MLNSKTCLNKVKLCVVYKPCFDVSVSWGHQYKYQMRYPPPATIVLQEGRWTRSLPSGPLCDDPESRFKSDFCRCLPPGTLFSDIMGRPAVHESDFGGELSGCWWGALFISLCILPPLTPLHSPPWVGGRATWPQGPREPQCGSH